MTHCAGWLTGVMSHLVYIPLYVQDLSLTTDDSKKKTFVLDDIDWIYVLDLSLTTVDSKKTFGLFIIINWI